MSRTEEKQATTSADDAMEDDDARSEAAPQASTDLGPSSPEKQPEAASWWPFSIQMTLMISSMIVCVCCARYAIMMSDTGEEVWTKDRLAQHGPEARTICVGFLGEVFEVTKGARFYGKDGGYSFFSGRDATKAFITGEFEKDLTDVVDSFGPEECLALVDWADFYHKEYKYVAKVEGNFYTAAGQERRALVQVRQLAQQGAQIKKEREQARKLIPDCSKKWSASEGGKVWCEHGMFPRLLVEHHGGKPSERCACFTDAGWSDVRKLYKDCPPDEHSCRTVPARGQAGAPATAAAPASPEHQEL